MSASSTPILVPHLIVGLGNPEPKYDRTRHNIGFAAVDALARSWQIPLAAQRKFKGEYGDGMAIAGRTVRLLKPTTYMNRSGESVQAVLNWYKLSPASVLVVYDDMDLPVGRIRLRLAGSAGGHNGMKSIISHLGSQAFPRLRVGIGKPQGGGNPSISHVLGKFSPQENQVMGEVMVLVRDAIELSLKDGVEKSMSLYNSRNLATPSTSNPSN